MHVKRNGRSRASSAHARRLHTPSGKLTVEETRLYIRLVSEIARNFSREQTAVTVCFDSRDHARNSPFSFSSQANFHRPESGTVNIVNVKKSKLVYVRSVT